jgi:hypothetical protein
MTTLTAAPTHHKGYDFVAVLVQERALQDPRLRDQVLDQAEGLFGVDPVLVGERSLRTWGANRAVSMLRNLSIDQLPWQEYQLH